MTLDQHHLPVEDLPFLLIVYAFVVRQSIYRPTAGSHLLLLLDAATPLLDNEAVRTPAGYG